MDWTSLGDISWSLWRATLKAVDSPILDDGQLPYETAKPHSALCLAVMERSTRYATAYRSYEENFNPFALQLGGSFPGLVAFDSWADAIEHWKDHSLPYYDNFGESATWDLAGRVAELLEQDRKGVIGLAVPGYLDDEGHPLADTLQRWFGSLRFDAQDRVFQVWADWGRRHGLYPHLYQHRELPAGGVEFDFTNGLHIYDDGTIARVVPPENY